MKSLIRAGRFLALSVMVSASAVSQGVHWESKTTKGSGDKERIDHFYYMPKMMKMVGGDQGMAVILRLDKELMTMVDTKKKTYYQMTFDEMEQMMEGVGAMQDTQMEAMRQQLAALPKEQREMAEKMMGSQMKPKDPEIDVTNTGETSTISGYSCTKYEVTEDGAKRATVWATRDVDQLEVMKEDMMEFARRMKAMTRGRVKETSGMMDGIDGFPIQTETVDGLKTVVTKIESRSTPESEFNPPDGFEKESMPGMGDMPQGY